MLLSRRPVLLLIVVLPAFAQLPRIAFTGSVQSDRGVFHGDVTVPFPIQPIPLMVNAPYSGHEETRSSQVLADGTHIARPAHTDQKVWRDSQGRLRIEKSFVSGPTPVKNAPTLVEIEDPVAGYIYIMDDITKVAHRIKASVAQQKNLEELIARGPVGRAGRGPMDSMEDLGTRTTAGVLVHGTRRTLVTPAGARGNSGTITATRDYWYSPDLNMIIQTVSNNPGANSIEGVADLTRDEPDPSLFLVPADYTLVDENATFEIKWGK
jgi:hypothetical protein